MTNKHYSFRSDWNIEAPAEVVWQTLTAVPFSWSEWWPELRDVRDMHITPKLKGTHFSCAWQAPIGYRLKSDVTISEVIPMERVTLRTTGDLVGEVICVVHAKGNTTHLAIDWQVETTKPWMNRLTFLLRPFFIWSHHAVMRSGERGLRDYSKKAQQ